jgi:heavy metal translocating P-type ATPase
MSQPVHTARTSQQRQKSSLLAEFCKENIALFVTIGIGIVAGILWNLGKVPNIIAIVLIVAMTLYSIYDDVKAIIADLKAGHVGADVLAVISLVAALGVQQFWAAWVVDLMVFSGAAIESYADSRAKRNLTLLLDAAPSEAHVITTSDPAHDGRQWKTVPVEQVAIGDHLLVRPGETVPVDGVLESETATLDLSMINGEPLPRDMENGEKVVSGAINGSAAMRMRATARSGDSQYQKILDLVRSAETSRATVVRSADILAVPFTIISLTIGIVAWICTASTMGFAEGALRFTQVLVLATPCPLLIAAPVAYMGGTGRLAHAGIIIKTQDVLENLGRVTHIFFDKTGTLTDKRPDVSRVDTVAGSPWTGAQVLAFAGPLEKYSVHILAHGIVKASRETAKKDQLAAPEIHSVREDPGNGVEGSVNGHLVRVGRHGFVLGTADEADRASQDALLAGLPALAPNEMHTYVSVDGKAAGRIVLEDFARTNAAESIDELKKMGITRLTMLTGDKQASADAVARQIGITDVRAELLPQEKVDAVAAAHNEPAPKMAGIVRLMRRLAGIKEEHAVTMMVGDGVNDAPTLASADIGIAMTDGSTTAASESAQVVIMNDDIAMVPQAVRISRQTKRTMLQATTTGLSLAIILMVFAAFNFIPVVIGAILQEFVDVVSILWGLTALFDKKK